MPITKPVCCELSCLEEATWTLIDGPTPDDYTEACTRHVGAMLNPERETVVVAINAEAPAYPFEGAAHG